MPIAKSIDIVNVSESNNRLGSALLERLHIVGRQCERVTNKKVGVRDQEHFDSLPWYWVGIFRVLWQSGTSWPNAQTQNSSCNSRWCSSAILNLHVESGDVVAALKMLELDSWMKTPRLDVRPFGHFRVITHLAVDPNLPASEEGDD